MKVLIAPDSYKGSLSAPEAALAIAAGWRRVFPEEECVLLPVADGGEGTLESLIAATEGTIYSQAVTGPYGEPVEARWGVLGDGQTAVIELAAAAGLTLTPPEGRDPRRATTRGVGELLLTASRQGLTRCILGLGGSATNDGGAGILSAVGIRLQDARGRELPPGGAALAQLETVELTDRQALSFEEVMIACDVTNPLTGPEGASAVFGPQKGASAEDIRILDAALTRFAERLGTDPDLPGMGAAGGAAYGLRYLFPGACLRSGIDLVLDTVGFDRYLTGAGLVITGEGHLDRQTLGGKAIAGVGRRAGAAGVPVVALVGGLAPDLSLAELERTTGVRAVLPLVSGPCSLEDALKNAAPWLTAAAERAACWTRVQRR